MASPRESLAGHFLIADLDLLDPPFLRSVVLLVDHNSEGAFGLVVNRPLGLTAAQIAQEPGEVISYPERRGKIPLFGGGPVETQAVFALHSGLPEPWRSPAFREIRPGLFFEPSFPVLKSYVSGESPELPPDDVPVIRLYLGYAGWAGGQLETELDQGAWQVIEARSSLVFQTPPQNIWKRAMEIRGGFWGIVAQTGIKPSLN
jgi:putative transcriptional regulator